MLKVLIVDDEEKITWLVHDLIHWNELDLKFAGCAQNGLQAIEMINSLSPDIVITDVRMPGIDGIELIRRVTGQPEHPAFVLISGHRQFEYAYGALKYGVEDYLLKPIKENEINAILRRLSNRIKEQRMFAQQQKKADNQRGVLRQQLALAAVSGNMLANNVRELNNNYGFDFHGDWFSAVMVRLDVKLSSNEQVQASFFCQHVKDVLIETLTPEVCDVECVIIDNTVISIFNSQAEKLGIDWNSLLFELKQYAESTFDWCRVSIGVSDAVKEASRLNEIIRQTNRLVQFRLIVPDDKVFTSENTAGITAFDINEYFHKLLEKQLVIGVEAGDVGMCQKIIKDAFADLQGKAVNDPNVYYRLCELLFDCVYSIIGVHPWAKVLIQKDKQELLWYTENASNIQEMARMLSDRMKALLLNFDAVLQQQNSRPVQQAKQYVKEHYGSQITIDTVSQKVGLSCSYFSVIFKQETGLTFGEYLTGYRMDIAKERLRSTNDTILSIAEDVGYRDVAYFSRLFTKTTGLKPAKFRKIYS